MGDPIVTGFDEFTFEGIRDHYDKRYAAVAGIPETDVRILVIAGLIKPATTPQIGDKIRIRGDDGTQKWHEMRSQPTVDPANAHFILQCFEIPDPTSEAVVTLEQIQATSPFGLFLPHPGWMWQDASGLTPVTADGQVVRRWIDQSVHNWEALIVAGVPPVYRTDGTYHWLEFTADPQHIGVLFGVDKSYPMERYTGLRVTSVGFFQTMLFTWNQGYGAVFGRGVEATVMTFNDVVSIGEHAAVTPIRFGEDFVFEERFVRGTGSRYRTNDDAYVVPAGPLVDGVNNSFNRYGVGSNHGSTPPAVMRYYGGILRDSVSSDDVVTLSRQYIASLEPDGPDL